MSTDREEITALRQRCQALTRDLIVAQQELERLRTLLEQFTKPTTITPNNEG